MPEKVDASQMASAPTHERSDGVRALEAVLDAHGVRPERWPETHRGWLAAFIRRDARAARLLAEAEALERLLGRASPSPPPAGLEARIMAAAAALPQIEGSGGAMPPRRPFALDGRAPVARPAARGPVRRFWPEAALLAASLFLGLAIGLSGQAVPALQSVAAITGEDDGWGIAALLFEGAAEKEAL
jgi:hypothetical protein